MAATNERGEQHALLAHQRSKDWKERSCITLWRHSYGLRVGTGPSAHLNITEAAVPWAIKLRTVWRLLEGDVSRNLQIHYTQNHTRQRTKHIHLHRRQPRSSCDNA